jgi:hypothetical protein
MLLANYASDSDSDNEAGPSTKPATAPVPSKPAQSTAAKGKKRAGPIKITLDLPKNKAGAGDENGTADDEDGEVDDADEGGREVKKTKIGTGGPKGGKGSSVDLSSCPGCEMGFGLII